MSLQALSIRYNYFSGNYSNLIRCENWERLCLSCNLSVFASQFQHSRIRALRHCFGQESHGPTPPLQVRRCLHAYATKKNSIPGLCLMNGLTEKLFRHFRVHHCCAFVIVTNSADKTEANFSNKMAALHSN